MILPQYPRIAEKLHDLGWSPIPIRPKSKMPEESAWNRYCERLPFHHEIFLAGIREKQGGELFNVGICCGPVSRVIAVDIDIDDTSTLSEAREVVEYYLGVSPLVRRGKPPRVLSLYLFDGEYRSRTAPIDFRYHGTQFVAFGTHPEGHGYHWESFSPLDMEPEGLPLVNYPAIWAAKEALAEIMPQPTRQHPDGREYPVFEDTNLAEERRGLKGQSKYQTIARQLKNAKPGNLHNVMISAVASLVSSGMNADQVNKFIDVHFRAPKEGPYSQVWDQIYDAIEGAMEKYRK